MRNRIQYSFILTIIGLSCFAQINADLQSKIENHFKDVLFQSSNISASVFDTQDNTLIAGFRPNKVLVPASSLKLFSCFAGLKNLGADFQFKTHIYYSGQIEYDGTLKGDIVIAASGDPTLGSHEIKGTIEFEKLLIAITNQILREGINCIEGKLIIDESIFDNYPVPASWQWNDLGNYYASGAWGFNIFENQYYIRFKNRTHLGQQAQIHQIYPLVPGLSLLNEVTIDGPDTGDNAYIFGGPYNDYKRIVGTIPKGKGLFTIKGSIPDPSAFFLFHLRAKLQESGVVVEGVKTINHKDERKKQLIMSISSPPLSDIIKLALYESNNLYAESILKMIGVKTQDQGSVKNGITFIQSMIRDYNIPVDDLHFHDGSGLSARNLVSSFSLAKFLCSLSQEINIENLIEYLPEGGKEGTVKYMFKDSEIRGNVWLKSGSMQSVQSYAGYIKTKSGRWISFSIIVNGFRGNGSTVRSKLDRIIRDIYLSC